MLKRIARLLKRADERDPYMDVLRQLREQRQSDAARASRQPSWLARMRRGVEAPRQ